MYNSNPTRLTTIKVLKSFRSKDGFKKEEVELNCHVRENAEDGGGWYSVAIGYPNVKAQLNFIPEVSSETCHFIKDMEITGTELLRVCKY